MGPIWAKIGLELPAIALVHSWIVRAHCKWSDPIPYPVESLSLIVKSRLFHVVLGHHHLVDLIDLYSCPPLILYGQCQSLIIGR